jgi:hypothetical protein
MIRTGRSAAISLFGVQMMAGFGHQRRFSLFSTHALVRSYLSGTASNGFSGLGGLVGGKNED